MDATELKKIERLAESGRKREALERCDSLLEKTTGRKSDVLRTRAYVLALLQDYERSLSDRMAVLQSGEAHLGDYFRAGQCALSAHRASEAESLFKELLAREERENGRYFRPGAWFLLAYAQMELGRYEEAGKSLDQALIAEPNCGMPVPGGVMWSSDRLRQEISRRAR